MASSIEKPPPPLKSKLTQVKYLLDDANKRLNEEMMTKNYEIFTTKTSASSGGGSSNIHNNNHPSLQKQPSQQQQYQDATSIDLKRTISDISTLKSVLSCPIFDRIVNVTDSLDKLSYHLNLHPSIGPSDINIDSNGELILAPPIEPASLNNLINSKLDEFSDHSNLSPHILSPNLVQSNNNNNLLANNHHQLRQVPQPLGPSYIANQNPSELNCTNEFSMLQQQQHDLSNNLFNQQYTSPELIKGVTNCYAPPNPSNNIAPLNVYDTEKLVSNGANKTYATSNKARRHQETNNKVDVTDDGRRLYKTNGHLKLDQVQATAGVPPNTTNVDFHSTQSMNQVGQNEQTNEMMMMRNGYSNEMYKTTHELNHSSGTMAIEQQHKQHGGQLNGQNNVQGHNISVSSNGKVLSSVPYNRGSCSPSTSAGSTVRLADECDSGASSYQSHTTKPPPKYISYPYKSPNEHALDNQTIIASVGQNEHAVDSMEQELIDNLSPEMERIEVTLEKDLSGLGITIAGYTCEKEEISGIFIKSITPNSPADRSGKIRTLDQIFAVNGRELLGYNNKDAVNVLRYTGKVVTLELMRYLAESKYQKLQTALAHAVPNLNTNSRLTNSENSVPIQNSSNKNNDRNSSNIISVSPTKSSIPISKIRDSNLSPTRSMTMIPEPGNQQQTFVHGSKQHQQIADNQPAESIYKNEGVSHQTGTTTSAADAANTTPLKISTVKNVINQLNNYQASSDSLQSQIPVAAQRGGTNKVIETKQGARNTIDIRSPVCQTTNATYVNKAAEFDFSSSDIKNSATKTTRSIKEASDEFGRLIKSKEPEWEKEVEIIEIYKDSSQGLGFTVKDYDNPKDPNQSIIMIVSLTPGGIAERDGRLSSGDLLKFVDDINLEGASLNDAVRALKKTNGQVTLGVLKLKRSSTLA